MAIFTNQAQLTYNGRTILSNIAQGEIAEPYTLTKTALGSSYVSGDVKTYVITLQNSSGAALSGVTVTDNLGEFEMGEMTYHPLTYTGPIIGFVNGIPSAEITPTDTDPTLSFSLPTVPAGGSAVIVYNTRVNSFAPLSEGSEITNTATASGGGLINPLTASETITVTDEPLLSVLKSVSPTSVTDGIVTYTITIENYGNTESTDAILTDTFDPILANLTATINGDTLLPENYTYNEETGLFTTNSGVITVPAATYTTNPEGEVEVTPGVVVITVSGTLTT